MMKKKLIAALLVCAMCASLFTACTSGGDTASSGSSSAITSSETESSQAESSETESSEAESSEAESSETESSEAAPSQAATSEKPSSPSSAPQASQTPSSDNAAASSTVALSTILDAVKSAYGENYLPSMDLTAEDLKTRFGLNSEDYTEAIGQVAMMSTQVDTFVAVHAKEGKAESIVSALNAYRDDLVNNSLQYPMNIPKVNASKVYQKGDYVFFIMLGAFAPDDLLADDPAAVTFHEEQNQIAIDAIDKTLAG
ncbi:DUF4358 domain-containing protein [Anaeromassilibacillus sp. An200]|uniref:DUF4358 domain-containing protein n=1 Tax=Candidatus Caccousia stercoris TaxID=2840723 RepID=A0A9D1K1Z3_9FIRM|nr:DUF4358 domain-containing protein [Anaeromassilibacillus sp. An200]OUP13840.1 hypothetical protein B5F35_02405 [Anaeromassilibacillus sp. An200]HIS78845.1 DUF4358 domain-containing protein [Candidatus Caccousia stercoris]